MASQITTNSGKKVKLKTTIIKHNIESNFVHLINSNSNISGLTEPVGLVSCCD